MSNMPDKIYATYMKVDTGHGNIREDFDWWPNKIGSAVTSYTRTDLVDALIEAAKYTCKQMYSDDIEELEQAIANLQGEK